MAPLYVGIFIECLKHIKIKVLEVELKFALFVSISVINFFWLLFILFQIFNMLQIECDLLVVV